MSTGTSGTSSTFAKEHGKAYVKQQMAGAVEDISAAHEDI